MKVDKKRIQYSVKGEHLTKPLIRYFYAPLARKFLYLVAVLNLPIQFVNTFNLLFAIFAGLIIFFYPNYLWIAGLLIIVSFTMDLVDGAWARYNQKRSLYGKWLDETNGLVGVFLVFAAGAWITFVAKGDVSILLLFGFATFAYMMMNYAGVLMELIRYRYELKENLSDAFKNSLSKKTGIKPSSIGFSFEYQWTIIAILAALNQFVILFWVFIILGNLQWMARYIILWPKR